MKLKRVPADVPSEDVRLEDEELSGVTGGYQEPPWAFGD